MWISDRPPWRTVKTSWELDSTSDQPSCIDPVQDLFGTETCPILAQWPEDYKSGEGGVAHAGAKGRESGARGCIAEPERNAA